MGLLVYISTIYELDIIRLKFIEQELFCSLTTEIYQTDHKQLKFIK